MSEFLTQEDQETVVNFQRIGDKASIYTSDPTVMTKLHKLCRKNGKDWVLAKEHYVEKSGEKIAETWECPKKFITFRSKAVTLSDEQKRINAERLRNANENNRSKTS